MSSPWNTFSIQNVGYGSSRRDSFYYVHISCHIPGFFDSIVFAFILRVELFDFVVDGRNQWELGWGEKAKWGYDLKMREGGGWIKTSGRHDVFNNVDILLALSVSHGALDSSKTKMKLVKEEALNIYIHLNGQTFCVCLLYPQFVCVLFIAILKALMPF